ncbi:MAG TPA: ABC transporter ATP-binding protein [Kutzneria sp.]|nr:ABC transporter ATP-binding protein [Kutzneria sp.]
MAEAISATDLVKVYGRGAAQVRALDGVSVAFGRARLTAITGASGSGKSTLMQCLAGLDTPTSGRVVLGDTDLTALSDRRLTRLRLDRVGFVFQSFNLLPQLTARENILLPASLAGRSVDKARLRDLAELLGIVDRLRHLPSELSGGQQQRVAIARAMLGRPEVIFADEPTGNLDSASSEQVLELLRTAVREFGQTTVMVTHDPHAASYADRIISMADGQVAA